MKEINQNEFMSNKHKNIFTTLNYTEHFLILVSEVTGCISIYAFTFFLGIPIGITSSPIEESRNYLIKEINQNEFMSNKHKNIFTTLNYTEHFLILVSEVTGCISIYAFTFFLGIPIGITSSPIRLKIFAITLGIK